MMLQLCSLGSEVNRTTTDGLPVSLDLEAKFKTALKGNQNGEVQWALWILYII